MNSKKNNPRQGTTLIITLGILSVISVLALSFLISARLQKQSATITSNRMAAENAIHAGLTTALRQIEKSLTYPHYTNKRLPADNDGTLRFQRMAPVSRWLPESYVKDNELNKNVLCEFGDILTSPTYSNSASINLITPEVLSLIPPALTNGLPLTGSGELLRSGWIPFDPLPEKAPLQAKLAHKPSRVAFAVFNCSGAIDANVFPGKPTQTKKQKRYFSQQGVNRSMEESSQLTEYLNTNNVTVNKEHSPFFHTSYDPNPNTFRDRRGYSSSDILGRENFIARQAIDLNQPDIFKAVAGAIYRDWNHGFLPSGNAPYNKFNINSTITNILSQYGNNSVDLWYDDAQFNLQWLAPTICIADHCRMQERIDQKIDYDKGRRLAWSIANFIDPDRIPNVSSFTGQSLPTRANYAVEDVPLISKISIFKIMGPNDQPDGADIGPKEGPEGALNFNYYDINDNSLSNHYATAVELWYPFAPNSPFENYPGDPNPPLPACYIGIYTNEADISTTTNRPLSSRELQRWFDWNFAGTSNSVMQILFKTWAWEYEQAVGWRYLDEHPLWAQITDQSDLWFTPEMTQHPSWPIANTNGSFAIEETPIYGTFYPETFEAISTNSSGVVSTNLYTYTINTNYWLTVESPGETNQFVYGEYIVDYAYPLMFWENTATGAMTNNLMGGFVNENGNTISLSTNDNYSVQLLYNQTSGASAMIYENVESGQLNTNQIIAVFLSPDIEPTEFEQFTNVYTVVDIYNVAPLYMPEDIEQSLNSLLMMPPTNSIDAFYEFMLRTPEDIINDNDWDWLYDYFSSNPSLQRTLLPQIVEPSLGNMTEKDKYHLVDGMRNRETTVENRDDIGGYFWTIYPKQSVSFISVEEQIPIGASPDSKEREIVTNCYALGQITPGNDKPNTMWIRPITTVVGPDIMAVMESAGDNRLPTDRIVDEAVMVKKGGDIPDTVYGWRSVTNIFIPDPRDNAYANQWEAFHMRWDDANTDHKLHHGVKELPFIHFNAPLQSIGDLGHIYTEYKRWQMHEDKTLHVFKADGTAEDHGPTYTREKLRTEEEPADTLEFSTLSGASLLDFITIKPNKPQRGLVQANTTLKPTLDILFSDVMVGWTNNWSESSQTQARLSDNNEWAKLWGEALTNDQFNTGWRSFADMLPELSTNEMHKSINVNGTISIASDIQHNYTEDVLRGIIDKVSFRQNVYVIILAAQTIAPGSSIENPNVLAEQRVAITVIRDAYSGNWTISDWRKLMQ